MNALKYSFLALAVALWAAILPGACASAPYADDAEDVAATDASTLPADAGAEAGAGAGDAGERPKHAAFSTAPSGFGAYGSGTTSGIPALTAINGDAGFVLTSVGAGGTPVFAPAAVSLPTPFVAGSVLGNDGGVAYWTDPSSIAVTGQDYQFSNTASDVSTYFTLAQVASGSESDLTAAVTSGGGQVLVKQFSTPLGEPGITLLPKGLYEVRAYEYASFTGAFTTDLAFKFYKRTSGGTETLLFTATGPNIQRTSVNSSPDLFTFNFSSDTTLTSDGTDRLVVKVYGETTSVVGGTVHFVFDGATHASLVQTPITGGSLGCGGACSGNIGNMTINVGSGSTITGTLPAGNQASQTMGGDISGTTAAAVVHNASGVVDNAYVDGGASYNIDAGETRICDTTAATGKACARGAIIHSPSFTDNSTWVTVAYHTPTNRSAAVYEWEYVVADQTDTVDAGVPDMATCHLIYTVGVSNGGNITITGFQGSAIGTTVALVAQSCTVTLADAGTPSTAFQFQAIVSGGQVVLQGKGIASKTYDLTSFALTHIGGL